MDMGVPEPDADLSYQSVVVVHERSVASVAWIEAYEAGHGIAPLGSPAELGVDPTARERRPSTSQRARRARSKALLSIRPEMQCAALAIGRAEDDSSQVTDSLGPSHAGLCDVMCQAACSPSAASCCGG